MSTTLDRRQARRVLNRLCTNCHSEFVSFGRACDECGSVRTTQLPLLGLDTIPWDSAFVPNQSPLDRMADLA